MTTGTENTIFALSTAPGRAGVAVVRVSGGRSWDSLKVMTGRAPKPRYACLTKITHPVSRETLDEALVLGFKSPHSYTGEDTVEYHLHGGRAVIQSVLDVLSEQPGHRMAEPGEFTRRAFENGKMDLTRAEAVADLIDAETRAQKIQALAQMGGALSSLYNDWTTRLKKALAHLEADIEFPDEDMPDGIAPGIVQDVKNLKNEMIAHLDDNHRGERLRDGIAVAVIGAPNAGKSSLVNTLARRDVAIVSDVAGTTRDVIDVHLDLGGYPVVLSDTAGLRPDQMGQSGQNLVEAEGIKRALDRARAADIKILMFDGTVEADHHTLGLIDEQSVVIINKLDQASSDTVQMVESVVVRHNCPADSIIKLSTKTGAGLEDLISCITSKAADLIGQAETPFLTRRRHREFVQTSVSALERGLSADLPELMAEDLRLAVRALGRITGRVDVEDLLDVIFKDFCIGK